MTLLFSWGIGSPPSPTKTAETSEEIEYANTLVINFSIKQSFVVHTIIQFLVKSHFHMFPLPYRNILGWYSSFADLAGISGWFIITLSTEEQTAISQIPQKPLVQQHMGSGHTLSEALLLVQINLEVWYIKKWAFKLWNHRIRVISHRWAYTIALHVKAPTLLSTHLEQSISNLVTFLSWISLSCNKDSSPYTSSI